MPHHSGGGSHSGGSHGGSHSSGSRGGSSGPRIHTSTRPFVGARRFRYHDRNGSERFIYSSAAPLKVPFIFIIITFFFMIPFVAAGCFMGVTAFKTLFPSAPKPLKPEYSAVSSHIEDNVGVIGNESELEDTLRDFQEKTGICPYIVTVYDFFWSDNYSSLADFAMDYYLGSFSDEQHFLVMFSRPEEPDENNFVEWRWDAIQGDDTDPIITEEKFKRFRYLLQEEFNKDDTSIGEAFDLTFSKTNSFIMDKTKGNSYGWFLIFFTVMWNGILLIIIFSIFKQYKNGRRDYEEVPMDYPNSSNDNSHNYDNYDNYDKYDSPDKKFDSSLHEDKYSGSNVVDASDTSFIDDTDRYDA